MLIVDSGAPPARSGRVLAISGGCSAGWSLASPERGANHPHPLVLPRAVDNADDPPIAVSWMMVATTVGQLGG